MYMYIYIYIYMCIYIYIHTHTHLYFFSFLLVSFKFENGKELLDRWDVKGLLVKFDLATDDRSKKEEKTREWTHKIWRIIIILMLIIIVIIIMLILMVTIKKKLIAITKLLTQLIETRERAAFGVRETICRGQDKTRDRDGLFNREEIR